MAEVSTNSLEADDGHGREGRADKSLVGPSGVTVLVYAPFSFNGRGPAESCASIVSGFAESGLRTKIFGGRFRKHISPPVELHPSLSRLKRHVPWRLVADEAMSTLNQDFARALMTADPTRTIAYFWPDPPIELVRIAKDHGIVTVREMINTACATSGPILDAAYARLGIPGSHSVTAEKISVETEELRLHDFLFASNPEVESSLSGVGVRPEQILRTTFGWTPERLAPRGTTTPHSGVRVLFVGTLSVRKGIPELLEAWRASNVDGELVLAGAMTPEVAELVRDHAKSGTIRTPGFVKDVANLFRGADIFAFPTLEEGGPQVTYEAAGCGLPVITTPMGAARLVETGITGMVVDPGSVSQLTEALNVLGSKADLREACGEQARRKADDFTYPRVAAQRASLLIGALRSRRRRQ